MFSTTKNLKLKVLAPLMMTLSTVYKNAYLEREVVDTALTLYLEVLKFRRMSMLCGPEGSKNLIVLPLEEKRRDENDEDEDTTKLRIRKNLRRRLVRRRKEEHT